MTRTNRTSFLWLAITALGMVSLAAVACGGDDDDDDGGSAGGNTLQEVIDRGNVICGVNDAVPGFGFVDADGNFSGFDVDFCRALAAAVLGDPEAVEFVPLTADARFSALSGGEIDVLIRNTTWTASRDGSLDADFTLPTFYDGQGMMVKSDSGFSSIDDMDGATICVLAGTTTEGNLDDRFTSGGLNYEPRTFSDVDTLEAAFIEGSCDGWTSDKSQLAARRSAYPEGEGGPESLTIFEEVFSKEPLGPATRDNDSEWHDVVSWVVIGMIYSDELGVTSANVSDMAANPPSVDIARLLGVGFEGGEVSDLGLGIDNDFMQDVLAAVGNYDEVYERNITPLGVAREGSLNASYLDGGVIYAPPMR